ncbi:MAG: outer membrane protein OmpA-like peptidoglycan-associated protein [Bacteroidia bacterium]|jgi:outer membrane protein OmpA-like peptidoglycan-associated protein
MSMINGKFKKYPIKGGIGFSMLLKMFSLVLLTFGIQPSGYGQNFELKTIAIYFNSDQDELSGKDKQVIRKSILEIGSDQIREIHIEGHADSDASELYNIALSSRRASNAKRYLVEQGVRDKMIAFDAFGEAKPLSSKKAVNRRVEITFVYTTESFFTDQTQDSPTNITSNIKGFILIRTIDAVSKKNIQTDFVLEKASKHHFGKTRNGVLVLRATTKDATVTFSKDGYLNATINLIKTNYTTVGDTQFAEVILHPIEVVQKLQFKNIFFFTDSDEFKPESKPELNKLVEVLKQSPNMYIEIQGHMNFAANRTASGLQAVYNHDLSHRRAKAVYLYLIEHGIDQNRLTFKGLSNHNMIYPIPKSKDEEDMNKRVEVWTLNIVAQK